MKNARHSKAASSANDQRHFTGTKNLRQVRALYALLASPSGLSREALDRAAGCSNAPDLIAKLRAKGLDLPCFKQTVHDRDGKEVQAGVYVLTARDRIEVLGYLEKRPAA